MPVRANLLKIAAIMLIALGMSGATVALADNGVDATSIKLGTSNAQTGSAAALGTGVNAGIKAFWTRINAAGGINHRQVSVVTYDDAYEPAQCVGNTRKLIEKDQVFALIGGVGTPTSVALLPILDKSDVIFFAPYTGAGSLRTPVRPNIFHVRASYGDETEGLVEHLTTDLGVKTIAAFIQDDAYGNAGLTGLNKALTKRGLTLAAKGTYARNTTDVDAAVAAISAFKPDAVVMVGAYPACAAFVKQCHAAGFKPIFCNISFVGTAAFIKAAGPDAEGVFISQVMPSPFDATLPIVKQYQADMTAIGNTEFDYTSLEGYVSAAVFNEALKNAGDTPTRASVAAALSNLQVDLGGFAVHYDPATHLAGNAVFFTRVTDGKPVPVTSFSAGASQVTHAN
jgi:ABC-type branched-subunit amino acid transport system substrate-binding protein